MIRLLEMSDNTKPLIEVTTKGQFTAYIYMHHAFLKDRFDPKDSDCKFLEMNILSLPKLINKRLDQDSYLLEEINRLLKEDSPLCGLPASRSGRAISPFKAECWDKILPNGDWRYLIEVSIDPDYESTVNWLDASLETKTKIAEMIASKLKEILREDATGVLGFGLFFDLSNPQISIVNDFLPSRWEILR